MQYIYANDLPDGAGIAITYQDWDNSADMLRVLEPFKDATEALEGDYIAVTHPINYECVGLPYRG